MAKPFLTEISVFDATIGTRASFKIYTSSATVTQYEYTIYDGAETNVVCKVEEDANHLSYSATAGYSFLISPNNNLKNRAASYYMKLRVKLNTDTDYGDYSSAVNLYCKEKPVLAFAELSSDKNKFSMASVLFNLVYEANEEQEETEREEAEQAAGVPEEIGPEQLPHGTSKGDGISWKEPEEMKEFREELPKKDAEYRVFALVNEW